MATWKELREYELTRENLALLLDNKIPAIRIKGFATPEECAAFSEAAKQGNMKYYNVSKRIGYIGMAQYEYRWDRPKSDYFHDVMDADRDLAWVFERSFNATERLINKLQAAWDAPVAIASELEGKYFAGIVRSASEGVDLHADWAPLNSPTYDIGKIDAQLGWNFFSDGVKEGGMTTVHNAPWSPQVQGGEVPKSYGLERDCVEGAQTYTYAPTVGDVVIFNTRNPHEISPGVPEPGRNRISIGSFVGRMPDRRLVLWA